MNTYWFVRGNTGNIDNIAFALNQKGYGQFGQINNTFNIDPVKFIVIRHVIVIKNGSNLIDASIVHQDV